MSKVGTLSMSAIVHLQLYVVISVDYAAERLRAGALGRAAGLSAPDEASLTLPEDAPAVQQPLAPQKQYAANMGSVIRALTRSRANGQLLHDSEWRAYEEAIASGRYMRHPKGPTSCISVGSAEWA